MNDRPRSRHGVVTAAAVALAMAGCTSDSMSIGGPASVSASATGPSATVAGGAPTTGPDRTGAAGDRSSGRPSSPSPSAAPRSTAATAGGPLATGGYDVLLESVDPARRVVAVNVVDYLTGDAAVRACREDGGHGTGESCRNGYIRDTPTPTRSMPVAGDATITMSPAIQAQRSTLAQVAAGLPGRNLYRLRVTTGRVTSLDEVYRP